MLSWIQGGCNFAFARFNDGEARILRNEDVGNKDGWFYKKDRDLIFRSALRRSLNATEPAFLYGLSSEESDPTNHAYLLSQIRCPLSQVTHGNLFSLSNALRFRNELIPALQATGREIVLIGSDRIRQEPACKLLGPFRHFPLKGCCVRLWMKHRDHLLAQLDWEVTRRKQAIFLVAAGPLAKILIYEGWHLDPEHLFLDLGSTLDLVFFGKSWRADHREPNRYGHLKPRWKLTPSSANS